MDSYCWLDFCQIRYPEHSMLLWGQTCVLAYSLINKMWPLNVWVSCIRRRRVSGELLFHTAWMSMSLCVAIPEQHEKCSCNTSAWIPSRMVSPHLICSLIRPKWVSLCEAVLKQCTLWKVFINKTELKNLCPCADVLRLNYHLATVIQCSGSVSPSAFSVLIRIKIIMTIMQN